MKRRTFLQAAVGGIAALATAPLYSRGVRAAVIPQDAPGAFVRPTGWGVCVDALAGRTVVYRALDLLQPARWHTYNLDPDVSGKPGEVPMVYSNRGFDRAMVRQRLVTDPGLVWMLGNEPEESGQANETPAQAAAWHLEFMELARSTSTQWQWCGPAVTLKPGGLAWLTEYVNIMRQYKGVMRPAYWCVHSYPSGSLAAFRSSWAQWRAWYATWGSAAPVVLSEVCAENAPHSAQVAVMQEVKAMLSRGEVAGVFWYIANSGLANDPFPNAALTRDGVLTDLGRQWRAMR